MLTNEQALELIKQHGECYVVWATDQNMIVAVHPIPMDATAEDRLEALAAMSRDYTGPTKGRFLTSATTTLQTLIDESKETARVLTRVKIFNSWTRCTIDQLIDILVNLDFVDPMDACHGSSHIVERIYKIRGPNLSKRHLSRLQAFAISTDAHPDQKPAQEALQCYLCVLANDPRRLKEFWQQHHSPKVDWSSWSMFTDSAGDLPTNDKEIIDQLVKVVETPFMFGPRYEAMVALGKIGPAVDPTAAQVIADAIYDSSETVTLVRDRAIRRIQSTPGEWSVCPRCYHGYVNGARYYGIPSVRPCSNCHGFGVVPKGK